MSRQMSDEQRAYKLTWKCPFCHKFIIKANGYKSDGSPVGNMLLFLPEFLQCPKCLEKWPVYAPTESGLKEKPLSVDQTSVSTSNVVPENKPTTSQAAHANRGEQMLSDDQKKAMEKGFVEEMERQLDASGVTAPEVRQEIIEDGLTSFRQGTQKAVEKQLSGRNRPQPPPKKRKGCLGCLLIICCFFALILIVSLSQQDAGNDGNENSVTPSGQTSQDDPPPPAPAPIWTGQTVSASEIRSIALNASNPIAAEKALADSFEGNEIIVKDAKIGFLLRDNEGTVAFLAIETDAKGYLDPVLPSLRFTVEKDKEDAIINVQNGDIKNIKCRYGGYERDVNGDYRVSFLFDGFAD